MSTSSWVQQQKFPNGTTVPALQNADTVITFQSDNGTFNLMGIDSWNDDLDMKLNFFSQFAPPSGQSLFQDLSPPPSGVGLGCQFNVQSSLVPETSDYFVPLTTTCFFSNELSDSTNGKIFTEPGSQEKVFVPSLNIGSDFIPLFVNDHFLLVYLQLDSNIAVSTAYGSSSNDPLFSTSTHSSVAVTFSHIAAATIANSTAMYIYYQANDTAIAEIVYDTDAATWSTHPNFINIS
ncbi:hypothetical protein MMC11_000840 [Xylographa trunciseda]|nr:hypothetical protein [Xylographa trunciseda]